MTKNIKRFKLWRTVDFLERHTVDWAVIDNSIEVKDITESSVYEGTLISYENLFDEEEVVDLLNNLHEENQSLKELLRLIADIDTIKEFDNVKDLIRQYIQQLETVIDDHASAWDDYVLLSNFFEDYYNEKLSVSKGNKRINFIKK